MSADREGRRERGDEPGVAKTIAEARARGRLSVTGEVISTVPQLHGGAIVCRTMVTDGTGQLALLFFGRSHIPGLEVGRRVRICGIAIREPKGLVLWNPRYEFFSDSEGL